MLLPSEDGPGFWEVSAPPDHLVVVSRPSTDIRRGYEAVGIVDAIVLPLFLANWLGGTAHVAVLQTRVRSAAPDPAAKAQQIDPALAAAQWRSGRRHEARRLQLEQPGVAADLLIGRPDLPNRQYDDGGLVDVNHIPAEWLIRELDLTPPLAAQIVDVRARRGGFAGPDELIVYCDDMTVERLDLIRDRLVFVPAESHFTHRLPRVK